MEGKTIIREKKEAGNFSIEMAGFLGDQIENYWVPEVLGVDVDYGRVYIRKVGNHIEIGKFNIEFIR